MPTALSEQAQSTIAHYQSLSLGGKTCQTPYYNNRRAGVRGGLAVLVGKGSPDEIEQEAELIAVKAKQDLTAMNEDEIKQFLVGKNLGIDCSGFAYHVLLAEVNARTGKSLKSQINLPHITNPLKKLLAKLHPASRIGTKTLAHDANSRDVSLDEIHAGDMIIILGYGEAHDRDHIMIVTEVTNELNTQVVHYAHSLAWSTDGKYAHGVRTGMIAVTDCSASILEATWTEQGQSGDANETKQHAKTAQYLTLRRLRQLAA